MSTSLVSIVIRSFNEGWALRDTLAALRSQAFTRWELIVIDSGSTDGSVELIRRAAPRHFVQIEPQAYHPPRVMNQGMHLATAEHVAFLNADATPQGPGWLGPLVDAVLDPGVAAAFGRQIPRPDCRAVFAHDYERCFGENRESARWEHFFSMASSIVRKDVWARRGFNERLRYSEDDEYTRWARARGFRVVYVPGSVVMHSHNYTPAQTSRRFRDEGEALAAVWEGTPRPFAWWRAVLAGWLSDLRRDWRYCRRKGRCREWPHAAQIRWRQRHARWAGFHAGWRRYRLSSDGGQVQPPIWQTPTPHDAPATP